MSIHKEDLNLGEEISITIDGRISIKGSLKVFKEAKGLVLFAHGSGSGRYSPRNRYVASVFEKGGLATLLIDLLTPEEEVIDLQSREFRFNIVLLTSRVVSATKWLLTNKETEGFNIGYFGASTGAAAALKAAAELGDIVGAVVSRGGRVDLTGDKLSEVKCPTLLIVGGNDPLVIDMNKSSLEQLEVEKKLAIVPEAGHLFEEPGALDEVSRIASEWFLRYLCKEKRVRRS